MATGQEQTKGRNPRVCSQFRPFDAHLGVRLRSERPQVRILPGALEFLVSRLSIGSWEAGEASGRESYRLVSSKL